LNKANKKDDDGAPMVETEQGEEDDSAVDDAGEVNKSNEEITTLKGDIQ
jgi:hypothetical protein